MECITTLVLFIITGIALIKVQGIRRETQKALREVEWELTKERLRRNPPKGIKPPSDDSPRVKVYVDGVEVARISQGDVADAQRSVALTISLSDESESARPPQGE